MLRRLIIIYSSLIGLIFVPLAPVSLLADISPGISSLAMKSTPAAQVAQEYELPKRPPTSVQPEEGPTVVPQVEEPASGPGPKAPTPPAEQNPGSTEEQPEQDMGQGIEH